ncbi:VpsF family polysaccharide biosynthesis protein [Lysobacter arenosi]|uniref:VpsF family polysaccharide biosynthesis protein n=1 Tax=Lysobacter arenosi TaxID=2795387 RepID=A0ABX7RF08_9GAMM|nr:VpsF family polysaccharide biosynthesis protein [Lysobacter arenosi]QSX76048.1 VpsF family polysaccharide biosynthesis protein [Lysobacter arenosi]
MSIRLSTVLYRLVTASILARLLLSNWLLDGWYPYSADGGQPYHKLHPGSILALIGVVLLVLVKGGPFLLRDLWRTQRTTVAYIVAVVFVSLVSTLAHGVSGSAYLVDTFLAAGCYPILLAHISSEQARRVGLVVFATVGLNAIVAIAEYAFGSHVLPQPYSFGFFRASALMGHPLANALVAATCVFASMAMPWRPLVKFPYIALLVASLFAFGARGALLVTTIGLLVATLALPHVTTFGRKNRIILMPLSVVGVAFIATAILGVIFGSELGYTIASRMSADDSTGARLASVEVLSWFSASELLLGVDTGNLTYLLEQAGVPIVENFWVGMLLRLGAPLLLVLCASNAFLLVRYARRAQFFVPLTLVGFLAVASTNNSLATKSCALVVLVVLLSILRLPANQFGAVETP